MVNKDVIKVCINYLIDDVIDHDKPSAHSHALNIANSANNDSA